MKYYDEQIFSFVQRYWKSHAIIDSFSLYSRNIEAGIQERLTIEREQPTFTKQHHLKIIECLEVNECLCER